MHLVGPLGRPFPPAPAGVGSVLVAGGVGLPPLRFYLQRLRESGREEPAQLLYGARSRAHLYRLEDADLVIALTSSDEVNMTACQVAYTLYNTPTRIARIRSSDYIENTELFEREHCPVDVLISPETLVTEYIARLIEYPGALQVLDFADGRAQLVATQAYAGGPLVGHRLHTLREHMPADADARVAAIYRQDKTIIPDGNTLIAMDAPPDKEDCRPFVAIAARMRSAGLHVPEIFEQDLALGFLLLEDLGSRSYLAALNPETVEPLYAAALAALLRLQTRAPVTGLPRYDRDLLSREMGLFSDWLLGEHLGLKPSREEQGMLATTFERLIDNALAQPVVCVHRDYHSRNLMLVEAENPGVIDFQDAVAGPVTYDLVSLLRDCYVRWPGERVDAWVAEYYRAAHAAGLLVGVDEAGFLELFDLTGVQRHLKAAGIFARLNHRDGKPGYLGDIPRTLGYVVEVGGFGHGYLDPGDELRLEVTVPPNTTARIHVPARGGTVVLESGQPAAAAAGRRGSAPAVPAFLYSYFLLVCGF